jgi:xylulokinase
LYLGIDLGTTGTKVALVDPSVGVTASASLSATTFSTEPGWAEADPLQWWSNLCVLIPRVLAEGRVQPSQVKGVAASGMVPAVLITDSSGKPRRNAILQSDARAVVEIAEIKTQLGSPGGLLQRIGSVLTQQSVAPTLLWLKKHEPEILREGARVVGSYDWLSWRLGGQPNVESNWALESGLFNLDGSKAADIFEAVGLSSDLVPAVKNPGQLLGEISTNVSAEIGLPAGTPVVVGGADHVLSGYAAGLSEPGDWLVKLGGAGDILAVTKAPVLDVRLYLDRHPIPGLWMPNGCMAASGSLLRWLQNMFDESEPPTLAELDIEARKSKPAQLMLLPYFLGEKSPLHDPRLRGGILGLHLGTTRGDLFRAALEAIGYGFRHHLDVFNELGVQLTTARVTNGGSKSRLWKEILASILNTELRPVSDHPGASLGAALLAAYGTGTVKQLEIASSLVRLEDAVAPQSELVSVYREAYETYLAAGEALAPLSHVLADRQIDGPA